MRLPGCQRQYLAGIVVGTPDDHAAMRPANAARIKCVCLKPGESDAVAATAARSDARAAFDRLKCRPSGYISISIAMPSVAICPIIPICM